MEGKKDKKNPNPTQVFDGMGNKYKEVHSVKTLVQLKLLFLVFPLNSVKFFSHPIWGIYRIISYISHIFIWPLYKILFLWCLLPTIVHITISYNNGETRIFFLLLGFSWWLSFLREIQMFFFHIWSHFSLWEGLGLHGMNTISTHPYMQWM